MKIQVILGAVGLSLLGACGNSQPRTQPATDPDPQLVAPEGLRLSVVPVWNVSRPDSVVVVLALYNGGAAIELPWSSELRDFLVIGPDGQRVPRVPSHAESHSYDAGRRVALPYRGLVGESVNLSCATSEVGPEAPRGTCQWGFDFSRPGAYRVVALIRTMPEPGIESPVAGRDFIWLQSDTVELTVRAETGSQR